MSRASIYRRNKNIQKGLKNRRNGIMRKANNIHRTYGAQIAVLMQYGGKTFSYESQPSLLRTYHPVSAQNRFGPGNFVEDADAQESLPSSPMGPGVTSENSTDDNTDDGEHDNESPTAGPENPEAAQPITGGTQFELRPQAEDHVRNLLRHLAQIDTLADGFLGD